MNGYSPDYATLSGSHAGILLGPTFLGHIEGYLTNIFPASNSALLDTYAQFGMIFQFFIVGVQVNPAMLRTAGRKDIAIGISVVFLPLLLSYTCIKFIAASGTVDHSLVLSLGAVAIVEGTNALPVIVCYLTELNILNTEFSRVTISSSMVSGLVCLFFMFGIGAIQESQDKSKAMGFILVTYVSVFVFVVFLLRPLIRMMIKKFSGGQKVTDQYLCPVLVMVILLACICDINDAYMPFGPFLFGMIIPSGPPLGTALVDRLEFFNTWMIMPVFYTAYGMSMDIFDVKLTTALLVGFVIFICWAGKVLGAVLPALYYNMSYKDAVLVGLAMNAQGFVEITVFRYLHVNKLINHEIQDVMTASILVITGAMTPLIQYLHESSMKYKLQSRKTIQDSEPNIGLRVLACVYDQENVPPTIQLLKTINPTKDIPINVSIIHFVELVGHAIPLIVSHRSERKASAATAVSSRIISVFRNYEQKDKKRISVHPFTVVSPYSSMHLDVCRIALQKWTALIIVPFHKQLDTGVINGGIRTVNSKVLENSPCSVGILIDRGILGNFTAVIENWTAHHVAMVFLGGPDDREALAIGERMSRGQRVEFTVIRLFSSCDYASDMAERSLDDEMVDCFKRRTARNEQVTYLEEQVGDGKRIVRVLESMNDKYELILLGRRHDRNSPLILELTDWSKCSELGSIGDIFTTSNYGGEATILVVQQQTTVASSSWDVVQDEEDV